MSDQEIPEDFGHPVDPHRRLHLAVVIVIGAIPVAVVIGTIIALPLLL